MTTDFDYHADARDRLAKCGGSLKLTLSNTKVAPFEDGDPRHRPHYRCTLKGPGGSYTFDFWDSIKAGETGEPATEYDVLACLDWHCPDKFEDFCAEFGYDADSRIAHGIWKKCLAQTRALRRVFPSQAAQERLSEIR